MMVNGKKTKKFEVPHSLVIIILAMILASLLTYIIPAGSYDRITNEAGKTVVDPTTFEYVESSPVNPLSIFTFVFTGLEKAKSIIFVLMSAGGGMGILLSTGMFQGAAASLAKKTEGKEWVVIAFLMTLFALLCIPINLNTFIPFSALGVMVAASLGLDAIVGISIVMLGGAVGFSCGAMNLSNTGTAQMVAELDLFSGMGYRLFCMIPFLLVTIGYVVWYSKKVKENPKNSYLYGIELEGNKNNNSEELPEFTKNHIPVAIVAIIGIGFMIYTAIFKQLTNEVSSSIFIYMGFASGIAYKMNLNKICKEFLDGAKGMAGTAMMLGFAYVIGVILTEGNVMDTVVNALAGGLAYVPVILQAPAMFIMHIIINFFITSGSGQAAVTMPIFIPVADLVGMSRQTAILAYNFGDGLCNFILPHAAATMGFVGSAGIPFSKWIKFVSKLFVIWCIVGIALLMLASVIGYS